jgi:hypothetical protein
MHEGGPPDWVGSKVVSDGFMQLLEFGQAAMNIANRIDSLTRW